MNGKLKATVAVLRSYNNKFVVKQINALLNAGIGRVIVVTDASKDKSATRGWLDEMKAFGQSNVIQLIEMNEGYSWSNALNIALKAIQMSNIQRRRTDEIQFRYVLNVSVEAQFTKEHLVAMLDEITDPDVGVVGTSFQGRQDGNVVDLGRSYRHPRNTGMIVRLETFGAMLGCFDARCDAWGGMEDIAFILEMLALSTFKYEMLDLKVPLVIGQHHHQPTKEKKEQEAMDKILAYWRSLFVDGSEERCRIGQAIFDMGLDR